MQSEKEEQSEDTETTQEQQLFGDCTEAFNN